MEFALNSLRHGSRDGFKDSMFEAKAMGHRW